MSFRGFVREGFSPTTLRKYLPRLEKRGLIQRKSNKVKGGWEHRYSLTQRGRNRLLTPTGLLKQLDQCLDGLFYRGSLERQLAGFSLIGSEKRPHEVVLTVQRTTKHHPPLTLDVKYRTDANGDIESSVFNFKASKNSISNIDQAILSSEAKQGLLRVEAVEDTIFNWLPASVDRDGWASRQGLADHLGSSAVVDLLIKRGYLIVNQEDPRKIGQPRNMKYAGVGVFERITP
jgi:hypothetical protein